MSLWRAAGFSKEQVDRFYDRFSELIDKYKFSPSKSFNTDKTGVKCVHTNRLKVIYWYTMWYYMILWMQKASGKIASTDRGSNVTSLN